MNPERSLCLNIVDLPADDTDLVEQAAALLVDGFREHWPDAWPHLDAARLEVKEALAPDRICRAIIAEDGQLVGWIGGIPQYDGHAWELHPLVVRSDRRQRGIGRALVGDLERQVRSRGALTLWLGSDDEDEMTSLANCDLFQDLPAQIARVKNLKGHPLGFYLKLGFIIAGVVPDANGYGKPDILMAKRVGQAPERAAGCSRVSIEILAQAGQRSPWPDQTRDRRVTPSVMISSQPAPEMRSAF